MSLRVEDAPLDGVKVIEAPRHADERGWFAELWNEQRYRDAGFDLRLVQQNASWSKRGVLRGMHYQWPNAQGKVVTAVHGAIFDVVVDVRADALTFGQWFGCELSADNGRQLWLPAGFAHGFLVLSDDALVHYGCTTAYDASADRAVRWNDPRIGIRWPRQPVMVSVRDRSAPLLDELATTAALPTLRALRAGATA